MKKIVLAALALYGFHAGAQVKMGDNLGTANPNAVLEMEATNKGFLQARVALTSTSSAAPLASHVAGMTVYNTATANDVKPGLFVNDGTKWAPVSAAAAGASVTAVCNGFIGTYYPGTATRSYTATVTNNTFAAVTVTPVAGDLVLSPASGLSVNGVSGGGSIASGASSVLTYTLGGNLTATGGTVITGTFTKLGLNCSRTVIVQDIPVAIVDGHNGTKLTFMAHNLGSDYSADPLIPSQAINGSYYKWGEATAVATAYTAAGNISGWTTTYAPNGSWNAGTEMAPVKTANDPCPPGFRVPTKNEWAIFDYGNAPNGTTGSMIGTRSNSATNFSHGMVISNFGEAKLLLPAAGERWDDSGSGNLGALFHRGWIGMYWSSTELTNDSTNSYWLRVDQSYPQSSTFSRASALTVRCIKH